MLIHGCLSIGRSSRGISTYNRREGRLFRLTVCRDQRSLPGKGNFFREGNLRSRIFWAGLGIGHGCLPLFWWVLRVRGAWVVIRRWFWRTGRPFLHRFLPFWHRFLFFRWRVCWWGCRVRGEWDPFHAWLILIIMLCGIQAYNKKRNCYCTLPFQYANAKNIF